MNNKRMQGILGRGLFLMVLVAIVAVSLVKVESVQAQEETIRVGQTVSGWIPSGDEIRWYRFEASPAALVTITMTRKQRDLAPYLALRYYDEEKQDYVILMVDYNEDGSDTAQVSAMLPPSAHGYWIEAASKGSTSGPFLLSARYDTMRKQNTVSGYRVTFTITSIVCNDVQDSDGVDELNLDYSMVQHTPYGTAIDVTKNKVDDMWMQAGWEFNNFSPLVRSVGVEDRVSLTIKLVEEDSGWNDDEKLAEGTNPLTAAELQKIADSGRPALMYWPVGNGQYHYGITYSVQVDKIN